MEKEKTYSKKEVEKLLDQQIADCADSIDKSNMSEYTAKRKVLDTKRVKL